MLGRKGLLGLPLHEIALIIVLAGVILAVLKWRVDDVLEQAERTAVHAQITHLRTGLRLEKNRRILAGEGLSSLVGSNPIRLLEAPPPDYCENKLPEDSRNPIDCPWSYRSEEHVLYYMPRRHAHLRMEIGQDDAVLGWKIVVNSMASGDVQLLPIKPYQWF